MLFIGNKVYTLGSSLQGHVTAAVWVFHLSWHENMAEFWLCHDSKKKGGDSHEQLMEEASFIW